VQFPLAAHGVTCELSNGRHLFENLSFSLSPGITGLVGANGVGKSCLALILAGVRQPTSGAVLRHRPVVLLAQREPAPAMAVQEYLGDRPLAPVGHRLLAGLDPHARCDSLSGGQWMRVRLARVLDDSFLILDEPTNDLDGDGRLAVRQFLQGHRAGTLLISHDRECLELCDSTLELTSHGLAQYEGGWTQYWAARTAERERLGYSLDAARRSRDAAQLALREQAQKRSRRQQHAAATAARGGMPRLLLGARKRYAQESAGRRAVQAAGKAESGLQAAHAAWKAQKVDPVMYAGIAGNALPAQGLVAQASSFNVCFGDWIYARDLEFAWRGNVRVAIQGRNGSGKSTLLQALRGTPLHARGELRLGDAPAMYLDQRYSVLRDDLSVLGNVAMHCRGREDELRNTLAQFLFTGDDVQQKVGTLSGGERLRAALALEFMRTSSPALMLLDEPTNNLDAANVEFLEEIVGGFRGALVVVSHDQRFLERCGVASELVMP